MPEIKIGSAETFPVVLKCSIAEPVRFRSSPDQAPGSDTGSGSRSKRTFRTFLNSILASKQAVSNGQDFSNIPDTKEKKEIKKEFYLIPIPAPYLLVLYWYLLNFKYFQIFNLLGGGGAECETRAV